MGTYNNYLELMKSCPIKRRGNFMIKLDLHRVTLMMDSKIKICLMDSKVEWAVWEVWVVWVEWVAFKIYLKTCLGSKEETV
jgi:hypothetical protein